MHTDPTRLVRSLALATAGWLLAATAARAATFTVSTLADNLTVDAQCSLREAIAAHNATAGANDCGTFDTVADTINFSVTGTILLNAGLGELTLAAPNLTIQGPAAALLALDGQDAMSVLVLNSALPWTLTVRQVTIQNGLALLPATQPGGGAIRHPSTGSAVAITIEDAALIDNAAQDVTANARGGAIVAQGALTIRRSLVARNAADSGAAISMVAGNLTLEDSEFDLNIGTGGGATVDGLGFVGQWTVRRCLFRRNAAPSNSAVISFNEVSGTALIENSTFQGNSVGALVEVAQDGANATVRNSTFAENALSSIGPTGAVVLFPGSVASPTELHVVSSLFAANNTAPAIMNAGTGGNSVLTATFNLFDTAAANLPPGTVCAGSTVGGANRCGIAAPGLNPLAANGGPTQTMALTPGGSPAQDAGSNPGTLATDQRGAGFPRVVGLGPDIGAFEVQVVPVELLDFAVD